MKTNFQKIFSLKVLLIVLGLSLFSFKASAYRMQVDYYSYDNNGHVWRVVGWVEIGCCPPSLDHWNLNVWDPNANKWFNLVGYPVVPPSKPGNSWINDGSSSTIIMSPGGYHTNLYDSDGHEIPFDSFTDCDLLLLVANAANNL